MLKIHTRSGFTLVELMVTLAIFLILVVIAVPSLNQLLENNKSSIIAEDMGNALNYARSEAIRRGAKVTLCAKSATANECGNNWLKGWIVVVDTAASDTSIAPVVASADNVLRSWDALSANDVITVSETRSFLRFTGLGVLAKTEAVNPAVVTISTTSCSGTNAHQLSVSLAGMLTSQSTACPNGGP